MNKLTLVGLCSLILCTNSLAKESVFSIDDVRKQVAFIENNECPVDAKIHDIEWVQQKLSCMVNMDQYVAFLKIDYPGDKTLESYLEHLNEKNTQVLKIMLKEHGWINISRFGRKADSDAWLLVQHADQDPAFQASVAFLLEALVEIGETNINNFAYLYDRVALKYQQLGLKQRYGTQFIVKKNSLELQPFSGTIQDINARRKEIGLPTVERYLNQAKATYLE